MSVEDARGTGGGDGSIDALVTEARVLRRLAAGLTGGLDLEQVSKAVVDTVVEEIGAHNCSLYLLDRETGVARLAAARGRADTEARWYPDGGSFKRFALGEGVCGLVAQTGRPILVDDTRTDERFVALTPFADEVRSLLAVPLLARGRVVGVINLSHGDLGAFSEENQAAISLLSAQAGIALANVQLFAYLSEANESLALSEIRFRELFTRANDALILIDETGHIVEANRRWQEFAGVDETDWENLEIEGPKGGTENIRKFLREWAFVSEGVRLEAALIRPDGTESVIEISSKAFPVRGEELCLVSLADVTEKTKLAEQLIRSERLAAVGEVTAALAHEVNNPLGALYNAVCLLKSDLELEGDNARLLDVAVEEAARLNEIVNDFLSFARFPHARFDWYDLNELVSATLFLMKRDERMQQPIEVITELEDSLSAAEVDRGQVQEILFNLISNALDAMAKGGVLRIRTYNARLDDRPAVGLLVEDNGPGIDPEDLEKVWAPFFTTKDIGTGLGLSIVRRIVEDHRGTVSIDSALGTGTRVSVVVPVSREEALWRQSS
ncbi:MAG: GAF domain-containing protein [Planctomycetota bacterium]|jgi:PAS domain S-box-containing protein